MKKTIKITFFTVIILIMLLFFVFHFIIGPPKWDSSHGCEIMTFRTKEKPIRGCVINKYLDKKKIISMKQLFYLIMVKINSS